MFSVFEGIVRDNLVDQIRPEAAKLQHESLKWAAKEATDAIESGTFYRVLAPFRQQHAALAEAVDQVRKYRNWVAHGKRRRFENAVTPADAFDRLKRFLDICVVQVTMSENEWLITLRDTCE